MAGVTLDTGVFIAVERRQRRALALWEKWALSETTLTAPAVVIAEWWRDRAWDAARWLVGVDVEPVDEELARIAGEVLGELRLGREHTIDAIVMASAAQRGDTVYTSDSTTWRGWRRSFRVCACWRCSDRITARKPLPGVRASPCPCPRSRPRS